MLKFFSACFFCFSIVLLAVRCGTVQSQQTSNKPNIIVILADDAGYADFGFMGSRDIETPHLDRLASEGTIFTDAHVSASVCSPSRAGLLTGRYQQRFGHECNLEPNQPQAFDTAQYTIAEFLDDSGYHTSIIGKWHLGEQPHQHPLVNGFDYFWGFLAGGRSYFPSVEDDQLGDERAILENYEPSSFDGYITDAIGDKAVEYINTKAPEKSPFFMYLSFNAPHTPMHAKEEDIARFPQDHKRPVYAAMIWSMDQAVGRVVEALKKTGDYENTIIFFLSDNGGAHNNGSSVEPLKGWKGNHYEGGLRVPFFVTWKNKLPAGARFDGLSSSLDIYKTVVALVGDEKVAASNLDGANLLPFLLGEQSGDPHTELKWRKDEMASVRMGDYKLITSEDSLTVLYNLRNDLTESADLKGDLPALRDSLQLALTNWEATLQDPLWKEPEDWNEVTRLIYRDLMQNRSPTVKNPNHLKKGLPQ